MKTTYYECKFCLSSFTNKFLKDLTFVLSSSVGHHISSKTALLDKRSDFPWTQVAGAVVYTFVLTCKPLIFLIKGSLNSHATTISIRSVHYEAIPKISGVTKPSKDEDFMLTEWNHSWVFSART